MSRSLERVIAALHRKTIKDDNGCWLFQGASNGKGHCKVYFGFKNIYIHRLSACYHWNFDLTSSVHILHKCNVPNCWNPEHLYEGFESDNRLDQVNAGQILKTTCIHGHPLDGIRKDGNSYCKTCNRIRMGYE